MAKDRAEKLRAGLQSISSGAKKANLGSLLNPTEAGVQEQPQQKSAKASKYGRLCAVVNKELQAKLQAIAKQNSLTFKEVLEQAMAKAVESYEAKYGEITPSEDKEVKLF